MIKLGIWHIVQKWPVEKYRLFKKIKLRNGFEPRELKKEGGVGLLINTNKIKKWVNP